MRRAVSLLRRVAIASLAIAANTASVAGQRPPSAGTVSGSVIDAATNTPLAGATVTLSPQNGTSLLADAANAPRSYALARTATTSATGVYRFDNLSPGDYRLYVQRVGYAPATVDLDLGTSTASALSIGLVMAPVQLRAVEIRATSPGNSRSDAVRRAEDSSRVVAARDRQHAFLATDVREISKADVAESATLGSGDVLRALQRLPGVTALDDWSAKLWVRGNRWDHNRIYYDGLPLFDPFEALGRGSGVSADAVGGAFLHPGVRPVSLGGEGSTLIDLRSRPASSGGAWRGDTELSQFGVSGTLEHEPKSAAGGFVLSARHSLGPWIPRGASLYSLVNNGAFSDGEAAVRGDLAVGTGRIETSGIVTRDSRRFGTVNGVKQSDQTWGNAVGRVTLHVPVGTFVVSQTAGLSHFETRAALWYLQALSDTTVNFPTVIEAMTSAIDHAALSGRIESGGDDHNRSAVGYDVVTQRSSFRGPRRGLYWNDQSSEIVGQRDPLAYGSIWAERRNSYGERVAVEGGLRLDVGGSSALDKVRPAGSVEMRWAAATATWLSLGVSRTHQYVQSFELPRVSGGAPTPSLWITSGASAPMMSIDNAMIGVERWMPGAVLLSANAYLRRTTGAIQPDPSPGILENRPLFVDASENAQGVEISARKLAGRSTGLLAYSYGRARSSAAGLTFPSSADRTHALDAAWTTHLGPVRTSAAYTVMSGAPFTRTFLVAPLNFMRETPNARRLPLFQALDLSVDYSHDIGHASLMAFAAVQNVLGLKNSTWYELSERCADGSCVPRDMFAAPVKAVPSLGVRITY